jgi:hypothetical protein
MAEEFENILLRIMREKKINDWNQLIIKEIGYEVLERSFKPDKKRYDIFFDELSKNKKKLNKFDEITSFYYFWCKRPSVYKILKPDFKLIVMFSVIESLMSNVEYLPLGDWLKEEMKNKPFSIQDISSLNAVLKKYYSNHGSNTKVIQFFDKYYSPKSLKNFKNSIEILNKHTGQYEILSDTKEVVNFIIGARNLFIHRATYAQISSLEEYEQDAEGYTSFDSYLFTVVKGESYKIDNAKVHIEALLSGFEEGIFHFFSS